MKKVRLELTHDELHTITLAGQTKRGSLTAAEWRGPFCKIPKALLNKMIVDHTRLVQYAKSMDMLEGHI